ncbi:MAG: prepilin-type N-terminal cleavage/methylation domain-containing protein [Candidatus Thiodiazotropha sp. (ex Lucinoma kastoroae)]|nr:prepilin-type N-terminal cleavage/methylation domain-containing protein [Candidatus Thiodiazotropha sp. (ex Lucinoma kastoroae)]MCU7859317.1 prepilin-type N-terminal cleavage/methylation domain-containing protein [Candidatus Thiodiazotropha sp. (ex Lucinoma kastoroae)]
MNRQLYRCAQLRIPGSAGFTLLELIVVLTIAGALVALVPPAMDRLLPGLKIKAASQEMADAMRFVRSWSIAQGGEGLFTLDLQQKHYTISPRKRTYDLPESSEMTLVSADDEQQGKGQGGIRFFPDGSSSGGRVILLDSGKRYQIDVDWLTGRVTVAD